MNMKKKLVAGGLVAALAATAIGGATLAYFTDEEEAVNTFSVGNVDITLTESEWVESDAKLIPGRVIDKNPTITLEAGSEATVEVVTEGAEGRRILVFGIPRGEGGGGAVNELSPEDVEEVLTILKEDEANA